MLLPPHPPRATKTRIMLQHSKGIHSIYCNIITQDSDHWRQKIKGEPANTALPGKWPLKRCMCIVSAGHCLLWCRVALLTHVVITMSRHRHWCHRHQMWEIPIWHHSSVGIPSHRRPWWLITTSLSLMIEYLYIYCSIFILICDRPTLCNNIFIEALLWHEYIEQFWLLQSLLAHFICCDSSLVTRTCTCWVSYHCLVMLQCSGPLPCIL